nr:immunoglobulin heavy chain junction region [Macaca mulatta]
CARQNSNLDYW